MKLFRVSFVVALASGILLAGGLAQAGGDAPAQRLWEAALDAKLFDRPDLLNFDPFVPTGSIPDSTDAFQFESMGVQYTTSVAYYTGWGFDCFSDPRPEEMLVENFMCVRAGHRRPNYLSYAADYGAFAAYFGGYGGFLSYAAYLLGEGLYTQFLDGLFGSEVYVSGYFNVMTANGADVFAFYFADIPDKLVRKDDTLKFVQKAFVDFAAFVEDFDEVNPVFAGFEGWFEFCELSAKAKGIPAAGVGNMWPPNKQGVLEKGKAKLKCDEEAIDAMIVKLQDDAGEEDAAAAASIFRAALAKLGSDKKLKLKFKDKDGTQLITFDDDDDLVLAN